MQTLIVRLCYCDCVIENAAELAAFSVVLTV